jgi:hypothetical protein
MRPGSAVLAAVLLVPAWAGAGPLPDGGVTAEDVAAALRAKGYKAEITTDDTGDPKIRSATDGSRYSIYFYGCDGGPRCTAIQFSIGFDLEDGEASHAMINGWNRDKRFGKAYLDEENDPWVEYDYDVERGVTTEALENVIDVWDSVVPTFKRHINFDEPAPSAPDAPDHPVLPENPGRAGNHRI